MMNEKYEFHRIWDTTFTRIIRREIRLARYIVKFCARQYPTDHSTLEAFSDPTQRLQIGNAPIFNTQE